MKEAALQIRPSLLENSGKRKEHWPQKRDQPTLRKSTADSTSISHSNTLSWPLIPRKLVQTGMRPMGSSVWQSCTTMRRWRSRLSKWITMQAIKRALINGREIRDTPILWMIVKRTVERSRPYCVTRKALSAVFLHTALIWTCSWRPPVTSVTVITNFLSQPLRKYLVKTISSTRSFQTLKINPTSQMCHVKVAISTLNQTRSY